MDLPRFVSILSTGKLWFAKAATFRDDPYEGFGRAKSLEIPSSNNFRKWITHRDSKGMETKISAPEMMANMSQMSAKIVENAREHLYVNSWCQGLSESMAMWQIYGSLGCGVAIRSSINRYRLAARFAVDSSHYALGEVTYQHSLESAPSVHMDFTHGSIPLQGPSLRREVLKLGFHKCSCYWYENEWRAVIYQEPRPEIAGVSEPFDLDELICAVYIGPRAEGFVVDAASSIMDRFKLRKPLQQSNLLSAPQREGRSDG